MPDVLKYYRPEKTQLVNKQNKRWPTLKDREQQDNYVKEYNPNLIVHDYMGTEEQIDTTPEKWRYRLHHVTGTGWEILRDGTLYRHTSGNSYDYIKGSHTTTIDGNHDHKVEGNYRRNIDGGMESGVKQDHTHYVGGSFASYTVGNHNVVATKAVTVASEKSITLTAQGQSKDQAPVRFSLGKDGTVYIVGAKHVNIVGAEDFAITAKNISLNATKGNLSLSSAKEIHVKSNGKTYVQSSDEMHLKASVIKAGPTVKIPTLYTTASPGGEPPDPASPAKINHEPEHKEAVATSKGPGIGTT